MKRSTTKRALWLSVLSMFLCLTMFMGTTFAWFTDEVTSGTNTIVAGNLDVELYHNNKNTTTDEKVDGNTKLFQLSDKQLWEPGAVVYENLTVANEGNLALKYQLSVNVTNATKTADGRTLADVLMVAVVEGGFNGDRAAAEALTGYTNLASFIEPGNLYPAGNAENNPSSKTYGIVIWWQPSDEDNYYNMNNGENALTIDLGVKLVATQLMAENDSFGPDYDEDAWMSGMAVYTAEDLQAAINAGETNIKLMGDITLDEAIVIPASATTFSMRSATPATVIDLNGKNITIEATYDDANYLASSAIVNNGNLILTGEGSVKATNNYTVRNYGTMVIDGITVENGIMNYSDLTVESGNISNSRSGKHAIYSNNAKLTINGGTFYNGNPGNATIFSYAGEVEINGGEFSIADGTATLGWTSCLLDAQGGAKFTINGGVVNGEIRDYNKNTVVYGGTFTHNSAKNFVADGYEAKANADGTYTVAMKEGTLNDLFTNVEDNGTVTLPQGTYTIPSAVAGKTVTIEGVGDNTVIDFTKVNNVNNASITFKNLHIQGKNENIMNGFGIQGTTEHITYENCTFDGAVTNEYFGSVSYINCTFTGTGYITTYAVKSAEFVNCTFDKADSRAVLVYSHGDNPCEVTLTDCTFKAAAKATTWAGDWTAAIEVDTTNIPTAGTSVTINNCTYDENYSNIVRDKSAAGKANAVITVDGKTLLTSANIKAVTLTSNTGYMLTGDFGGQNVYLVMPVGVENVIFDGSKATNINELIIVQNGKIIDNANDPIGERSGNVTVQNFNVLSQINVFACKTEVVVQKNTAEALMIHAGNCDVKVLNNTIDANFESHPTYQNATQTWNTNNYGITLNIFDYNLWLDGNTVTDATGHAIGINGWETTIDNGDENVIESFKGNTITVNSTTNTKRAAFKVWDDETYASNDDATDVVNDTAKAFIAAVLADGSNTFNIVDGYDHTIFCFYNVNTND